MSDRALWLVPALVLAAAAVGAAPLSAQSVAELERRVDRLRLEYETARARRDSQLEARRIPAGDTLRLGPLTAIAGAADLERTREAIAIGWIRAARDLGVDSLLVAHTPIHLALTEEFRSTPLTLAGRIGRLLRTFEDPPGPGKEDSVPSATAVVLTTGDGLGLGSFRVPSGIDMRVAASGMRDAVWAAVASQVDSSLVSWGGHVQRDLPERARRIAYRELVTSPYSAPRACIRGDPAACRLALGLVETDNRARGWYREEDLPILEARRGSPDDPPASLASRQLALAVAREIGGPGALGRMIESRGSVPQRIAHVAGVSVDSVVSAWRAEIAEGAGRPTAISGATAASAIVWLAFLVLMGLGGRRWR